MTLFYPDLNVWLALTVEGHRHNAEAWNWLRLLPDRSRLLFSWYTQLGMLRLLTNRSVMGDETLTLRRAWETYDLWLQDPRVAFYPEPRNLDRAFRETTVPFDDREAAKWVGDCYLLAWAGQTHAVLVTFDVALRELARNREMAAIVPG